MTCEEMFSQLTVIEAALAPYNRDFRVHYDLTLRAKLDNKHGQYKGYKSNVVSMEDIKDLVATTLPHKNWRIADSVLKAISAADFTFQDNFATFEGRDEEIGLSYLVCFYLRVDYDGGAVAY